MSSEKRSAPPDARSGFGPIENEPPQRLFHRMGLAPAGGLGTGRRALLFAAVTWLPIMAWATLTSHLVDTPAGEPLVEHFGVHVRCLIAIPLFILAEAGLNGSVKRIAAQFRSSGAVQPAQEPAFEQSLLRVRSLRDSSLPWVFVLGLTLTWLFVSHPDAHQDAYSWAVSGGGTLGFGGWWFAYVVRPIFLALLLGWIWRIFLLTSWLWRVGRLELSLVASHADRSAGLGFVEKLPIAIAPVTFGLSSVIAGHWAHELAYHDAVLKKFTMPAAAFAILWTLFCLLPLLALGPALMKFRARAIPAYGEVVGEQGRLVYRRWIKKEKVDDPLLGAPEIGPVVDTNSIFEAVERLGFVPIRKATLAMTLLPLALPMIAAVAVKIPIKQLILGLVKAVV